VTKKKGLPSIFDWKAILGIGLGIGLLFFALRGVDFGEVLREIRHADPLLFLASVVAATIPFALRAIRWRWLLEPVRPGTRFRPRFMATSIGFMGNNLLPARIGEFARAYTFSRMQRIPVTASLGSMVIERLFDAICLLLFLLIAIAAPGFPPLASIGGWGMGTGIIVLVAGLAAGTGMLLAMAIWPKPTVRLFEALAERVLPRSVRRPVIDALEAFLSAVVVLRRPMLLLRAGLWSLAVWGAGALSFWLGFLAFDIEVPFVAALFLQSVVSLAVSLPSAPGFFGLFEAGVRIGLVDVFGVEVNKALGFGIGFHIGGFIPITVIGLYYAWRIGLSWQELEHSEELVEDAVEQAVDEKTERHDGSAAEPTDSHGK
jgi:glycosyltransferase 2 family protein